MKKSTHSFLEHHPNLKTGTAVVTAHRKVAEKTWRITLDAPELAPLVRPGQFLMIRLPDSASPLLGRPFAVYSADERTGEIEVIYLTVGRMTERLAKVRPGENLQWWGPLGNGWDIIEKRAAADHQGGSKKDETGHEGQPIVRGAKTAGAGPTAEGKLAEKKQTEGKNAEEDEKPLPFDHLVMVAGGIGQTPFFLLAQRYVRRVVPPKMTFLFGARNKDRMVDLGEFERLGIDVTVATEDGSAGRTGLATDFIEEKIAQSGVAPSRTTVAACGPHPMLLAVFSEAKRLGNIPCFTSLESPMSCGMGLCFGCVIEYLGDDGKPDYRRTCVDGPVFDAYRLVW